MRDVPMGGIHAEEADSIFQSIIRAYYTPNVQFEVLFGALVRSCLADMVNEQCGLETSFVASEVPIQDKNPHHGNAGAKVDFVLADQAYAYWVELKTTKGLQIQEKQYERYKDSLEKYQTFGKASGDKFMAILKDKYKQFRSIKTPYDVEKLKDAFHLIMKENDCERNKKTDCESYVDAAMEFLKRTNHLSSYKYLFTLAQLLEYLKNTSLEDLWGKKLKLIYVTPDGSEITPDERDDDCFYQPTRDGRAVSLLKVSLLKSVDLLRNKNMAMLADIVEMLYNNNESGLAVSLPNRPGIAG